MIAHSAEKCNPKIVQIFDFLKGYNSICLYFVHILHPELYNKKIEDFHPRFLVRLFMICPNQYPYPYLALASAMDFSAFDLFLTAFA